MFQLSAPAFLGRVPIGFLHLLPAGLSCFWLTSENIRSTLINRSISSTNILNIDLIWVYPKAIWVKSLDAGSWPGRWFPEAAERESKREREQESAHARAHRGRSEDHPRGHYWADHHWGSLRLTSTEDSELVLWGQKAEAYIPKLVKGCCEAGSLCTGYQHVCVQWERTHSYSISYMKQIYYLQTGSKGEEEHSLQAGLPRLRKSAQGKWSLNWASPTFTTDEGCQRAACPGFNIPG